MQNSGFHFPIYTDHFEMVNGMCSFQLIFNSEHSAFTRLLTRKATKRAANDFCYIRFYIPSISRNILFMVHIYCTQKLGKFLNTAKGELPERRSHDWSAHLFFLSGRKCIIFVHKKTLYSVLLLDIFKKDMVHLSKLFLEALISQLEADKIPDRHQSLVRTIYREISLVPTDNDRKTLGVINNMISIIQAVAADGLLAARQYEINKIPWQALKYAYPKDIMLKELIQINL